MGAYSTQLAAWQALMSVTGEPVEGATVWCEAKVQKSKKKTR